MLIEIPLPIFKCEMDEDVFLLRLHNITSFESIKNHALSLQITFVGSMKEEMIEELKVICNTWGTTFKVI